MRGHVHHVQSPSHHHGASTARGGQIQGYDHHVQSPLHNNGASTARGGHVRGHVHHVQTLIHIIGLAHYVAVTCGAKSTMSSHYYTIMRLAQHGWSRAGSCSPCPDTITHHRASKLCGGHVRGHVHHIQSLLNHHGARCGCCNISCNVFSESQGVQIFSEQFPDQLNIMGLVSIPCI